MEVSQILLEKIIKFATSAQNVGATIGRTTGYYLGRAIIVIQAHPIPAVIAAIVVVAVAIFAYKYYIQPTKSQPLPDSIIPTNLPHSRLYLTKS
jgi:hypothetical protein